MIIKNEALRERKNETTEKLQFTILNFLHEFWDTSCLGSRIPVLFYITILLFTRIKLKILNYICLYC